MSLSGVNPSPLRDKPLSLEPRPTTNGGGASSLLAPKTSDNPQIGMAPIQLCALADPPVAAAPTSYANRDAARADFNFILNRLSAGAGTQLNNRFQGTREVDLGYAIGTVPGERPIFLQAANALQDGIFDGPALGNLRHLGFQDNDIPQLRTNPRARMLASTIIRYVHQNWTDGQLHPFSQGTGINYIYNDDGPDQWDGGRISPGDLNGLRTATGTGNATNQTNATTHSDALWRAIDQAVIR